MKIGIVGMGWVGSSVARSILECGIAQELLLADLRHEVAEGEAMDLAHGGSFYPSALVRAAAVEEMKAADAVVIAAGRGGKPNESRLDLLKDNIRIVAELASSLCDLRGMLVLVTNPVDIMVRVAAEASGLPIERVIGTGTMLDTARLRQVLARDLRIEARSIHAQVVGEHGDSEVVLWSSAQIGGVSLRSFPGWAPEREGQVAEEVRRAAYEIIRRKGATNHAIGFVTAALLRWMLRGDRRVLNVSRMQKGLMGITGVALSLPSIVSAEGAFEVLQPEMDAEECSALEQSAEVLKQAYERSRA